ncbi:MAG: DASH family cryptochrome [Bacteriovoracaceae bacterium]|nr:DASH family cryptochrome [Bacteriovoracaceae bacterium]
MKVLYYFRNDLRLQDNPLLNEALDKADEIMFIAKAPQDNWGHWRQKFHWESLLDLKEQLLGFGHDLAIIKKIPTEILKNFDFLYTPLHNTHYESREMSDLSKEIKIISYWTDRLLKVPPSGVKNLPDIFTDFRKQVELNFLPRLPEVPPKNWPINISLTLSTLEAPSFDNHDVRSAFPFKGGEKAAIERLRSYTYETNAIESYKKTRNGLIGTEYSTKFSPWLALGCLSANAIFHEVESYESRVKKNQDTYWVKFELWWREYFRWVFEKYYHSFFSVKGIQNKSLDLKNDIALFEKWCDGKTGNDFVDANMLELKKTGFMSNRGRQNVASFLIKDLLLNWQWGAEYFENQLIDYDVYSNWGNWQYIAGIGNDPRPNRYFNTLKQASVYDQNGAYRRLWES